MTEADSDETVVVALRAAVAVLNHALGMAAAAGIEVTPEFAEATAMEHVTPALSLRMELTKVLGRIG